MSEIKKDAVPSIMMLLLVLSALLGCTPSHTEQSDEYPIILPDYVGVTVPETICEMPFRMADGSRFKKSEERVGDTLFITVTAWKRGEDTATRYRPFPIYISRDEIDPYIAYRLIEPGYESWRFMGIYQRELASFRESPIVTNRVTGLGCVNCHSFIDGNPEHLLFHARGAGGGTIFISGEDVQKVDLTKIGPGRQGVYPHWHPEGRYAAFSSNTTYQDFHIRHEQPLEVFDMDSDLLILDTETMEVTAYTTSDKLETFPCWSPDGSRLFYCAADNVENLQDNKGAVHYRLMSREFRDGKLSDEALELFGDDSCSVSFPRISGDKMMMTISSFGTFPIWHKEADLWMLDLATGEAGAITELNSDDTESYHSWSSNGKWVVFSSRRIDGRYTRLFIAHFNPDGTFDKPFQLPQESADYDELRLKSYNIPEFVKGEVADYRKQVKKLF